MVTRLTLAIRGNVSMTTLVVLALAVKTAIALALPWHMDEFVMYRAYVCWSPLQQLNTFGESCESYETSLGPIDFHRSYTYIGITSSLLIAPITAVLPFTWLPAVPGMGYMTLGAWGIQRAFRLSPKVIPALMLVFPLHSQSFGIQAPFACHISSSVDHPSSSQPSCEPVIGAGSHC